MFYVGEVHRTFKWGHLNIASLAHSKCLQVCISGFVSHHQAQFFSTRNGVLHHMVVVYLVLAIHVLEFI